MGKKKDWIMATILILILISMAGKLFIDETYKEPMAAEKANQICKAEGYDFYEDFERIGILSDEPVAIKCKYVDNYQEMDIVLRQIYGGASSGKELKE